MELIFISLTGITAILSLIFGIRVYYAGRENRINRSFAFFAIIIALWIVLDFSLYQATLANFQTFLNRFDLVVICLMVVTLSLFVSIFPKDLFKIPKVLYYFVAALTLLIVFLILVTNQVVQYAFMEDYGSNFKQGNGFFIFAIFATLFALYPIVVLIIKIIKYHSEERKQIKYILYGVGTFLVLNLIFNLFIPIITKSFVYGRFGSYSAIFLVGFIAYAILKTRLFNLRIIVTESAVVIINVILAVQLFTSRSLTEYLLRLVFLGFVFYGSDLLLQSVKREIKFREELQQLSEQLAHANSHLKELDKMKTEFVSLASHELLTPVSAIEGYLSMLLDEKMAKIDDPKALKYMNNVYSSAKRLARLIADMLNISRIEEGRLSVDKKDISLSDIINQVIDEIKFKAEEKKQKIVFEGESETSSEILRSAQNDTKTTRDDKYVTYGDADKIKEVIINLVGNSIKYSKDPGTINIRVEKVPTEWVKEKWQKIEEDIKDRPLDDQEAIKSAVDTHFRDFVGNDQLMIAIKDTGIGIPKDELPRLFKKFHRVGDYTTAESQGSGLGLYISRALVELHHGRIWADSEGTGKGSTFTFTLPDISDKDALLEMEAQAPKQKESLKPLARPTKAAEEL